MSAEPVEPLFLLPRLVFDAAFVGWARRPGDPCPIAVYDNAACVKAARYWYDMTPEDAQDYVSTQCAGTWLGPGTPLVLHTGTPTAFEELQ